MGVKWKAFGFQRRWSKRRGTSDGSVWTEDDGPDGTWTVKCSDHHEDDTIRDAKGAFAFPNARRAMQIADRHIKEQHSK